MEQAPRTSFIPKQGFGPAAQRTVRRRRRVNLLGIVGFIIFFGAALMSGGLYFYADYRERELDAAKQELAAASQTFDTNVIADLQALDGRLMTARTLLDGHVSPSLLLETLEQTTQSEVQFTSFSFERRPSGAVGVEMEGAAPRFNTVMLQSERFSLEPLFTDVIFSSPDRSPEGGITFMVNLELSASALAYRAAEPEPLPIEPADDFELEELAPTSTPPAPPAANPQS